MDEDFYFFSGELFALVDFRDHLFPEHFLMGSGERALTLGGGIVGKVAEAKEAEVEGDVEVLQVVLLEFDVFGGEVEFKSLFVNKVHVIVDTGNPLPFCDHAIPVDLDEDI